MATWLEATFWLVALLSLYEGLVRWIPVRRDRTALAMILFGVTVIAVGASLWYWAAIGAYRLAEALQNPPTIVVTPAQVEELKSLPLSQRQAFSRQMATAAFVSGGDLLEVATDDGRWAPYSPTADDIKARDRQVQMTQEVSLKRQELTHTGQAAEKQAWRWLLSLMFGVCGGLAAARMRVGSSRE